MNDWLEVTVETTDAQMDDLCARLTMNGAEGLVLESESDFQTFLEQNRQYWDYVDDALLERMRGVARIKFYVTDDAGGREQMAQALRGIENPVSTVKLKEEDWAYGWQKYYQPMPVGEKVYIVPEWERGKEVPEGRTAVYLNPGLTFGTGSHASTQLCLTLLEKYLRPMDAVLDLGCGSGILSIASLKLGARHATAIDIDEAAVKVAAENMEVNHIPPEDYSLFHGNLIDNPELKEKAGTGHDIIVANILADVILPLTGIIRPHLKKGGLYITSGIIDLKEAEIYDALIENGFEILHIEHIKEWCCFIAK